MEEFWSTVAANLAVPVALLITSLVSLAFARLIKWIDMKTGNEAVVSAAEMVRATVNEVNSNMVKQIREAASDGKLTVAEAISVKESAVSEVQRKLPKSVSKAAGKVVGDVDNYIRGKIEEAVVDAKTKGGKYEKVS